ARLRLLLGGRGGLRNRLHLQLDRRDALELGEMDAAELLRHEAVGGDVDVPVAAAEAEERPAALLVGRRRGTVLLAREVELHLGARDGVAALVADDSLDARVPAPVLREERLRGEREGEDGKDALLGHPKPPFAARSF